MKTKVGEEKNNKTRSCALVRFFNKVGDVYVKMMYGLANQVGSGCGPAGVNVSSIKSFSVNSSRLSSRDQDLAELVKIASRRGLTKRVESEFLKQRSTRGLTPHRRSVGMEKINEDEACDFGESDGCNNNFVKFPRSRSHAVLPMNNGVF